MLEDRVGNVSVKLSTPEYKRLDAGNATLLHPLVLDPDNSQVLRNTRIGL